MRLPSYNGITLRFGVPSPGGGTHNGTDFAYGPDHTVYAPEAGRITLTYDYAGSRDGNMAHLWVGNRHHAFCHMSLFQVSEGQQVDVGQPLGQMGYTGLTVPAGPSGAHLHWALAVGGSLVNSLDYVTAGKGADSAPEGDEMINDYDNEFNRWRVTFVFIRGREPSREEFRAAAVGKTWLKALEILEDSTEATATQEAQQLGQLARQDNWQGQIYGLQDALTKTNQQLTELQAKANLTDKQQKQIDELKAANQACIDQQTKEEEQGKSIFRVIARLFSKSKK